MLFKQRNPASQREPLGCIFTRLPDWSEEASRSITLTGAAQVVATHLSPQRGSEREESLNINIKTGKVFPKKLALAWMWALFLFFSLKEEGVRENKPFSEKAELGLGLIKLWNVAGSPHALPILCFPNYKPLSRPTSSLVKESCWPHGSPQTFTSSSPYLPTSCCLPFSPQFL